MGDSETVHSIPKEPQIALGSVLVIRHSNGWIHRYRVKVIGYGPSPDGTTSIVTHLGVLDLGPLDGQCPEPKVGL